MKLMGLATEVVGAEPCEVGNGVWGRVPGRSCIVPSGRQSARRAAERGHRVVGDWCAHVGDTLMTRAHLAGVREVGRRWRAARRLRPVRAPGLPRPVPGLRVGVVLDQSPLRSGLPLGQPFTSAGRISQWAAALPRATEVGAGHIAGRHGVDARTNGSWLPDPGTQRTPSRARSRPLASLWGTSPSVHRRRD